jgi:1-aminocyclopropane-1-carboxylate deaminase/D-cysteine desulfhydrase-like pyridoxal-dependent ACC family enzyme
MDRLAEHLGMPRGSLWVKRDDATGLAAGGNKARKLEYLCADALRQGSDWLITSGGPQSNHARMTAAAAAHLGLGCSLVLDGERPTALTGNLVLDHILGGRLEFSAGKDPASVVQQVADGLRTEGHRPYIIPLGGSTALGALGYVHAALELREQDPAVSLVVLATSSCGTHAGLVAGFQDHRMVLGVDAGSATTDRIEALANETAKLAGLPAPTGRAQLDPNQQGAGYGQHTDAAKEAIRLGAGLESLILDPVYTGKAMAGLIAAARGRRLDPQGLTVFLHTGGLPGLLSMGHADWAVRED